MSQILDVKPVLSNEELNSDNRLVCWKLVVVTETMRAVTIARILSHYESHALEFVSGVLVQYAIERHACESCIEYIVGCSRHVHLLIYPFCFPRRALPTSTALRDPTALHSLPPRSYPSGQAPADYSIDPAPASVRH